jgi:Contractile injection system tube protein/LysM domain
MALEKATIINLDTGGRIPVMFNPEEYTLDMGNTIAEVGIPGLEKSPIQYVRGNLRTLHMELFFDTYEKQQDVRAETQRITALLEKSPTTKAPPVLLVTWGSLQFNCVLETVGQRFIMFLADGTPVRARLTVAFKEFEQVVVDVQHGFFIGPPTVRNLLEGETLSKLAHEYLGDAGAWRAIAALNNINDPRRIPPGTPLLIPPARIKTRP